MKKIFLGIGLAVLSLCAACGSGGGPTPVGNGNLSNGSLLGQYAYRVIGVDGNGTPYSEAGTFIADGHGKLTSGVDDFVQGTASLGNTTTGNYSVNRDGTGSLTLNFGGNVSNNFAITLVNSSKFYLIEADAANSYGVAELQAASVVTATTTPIGTFTFRMHDEATDSRVGVMTIAAGGAITGTEDLLIGGSLDSGTTTPLNLVGTLTSPSLGRGSGNFSDGTTFQYYVIDANNVRFLRTDSGVIGLGRAEAQTGAFSNASLSGGYAFGSRADDQTFGVTGVSGINAQNTVGQIILDGNGKVTGGTFDSVRDGNTYTDASITATGGTYAVDSSGRAVVNFSSSTLGNVQQIFWLVNSSRAFFLTNDTSKYEDGIADLQQLTTFSNSSLSGQYAFVMDGSDGTPQFLDRVGWLNADGAGNLKLSETFNSNFPGSLPNSFSTTASGAYAFTDTTSGRATSNILQNPTNDLVFYVVSSSKAYLLQNDSLVEVVGDMELQ